MYFKKDWNESGIPLAYLISFRTYGTWLHGDSRGSTDKYNNSFGDPHYPPDREWKALRQQQLKTTPVKLDKMQRKAVKDAIEESCEHKNWGLLAKNVRTNHVHTVLEIGATSPSRALNTLKSYATRKMRERGLWSQDQSPWSRRGSKKRLWNDEDVFDAIDYVLNGQGPDLE